MGRIAVGTPAPVKLKSIDDSSQAIEIRIILFCYKPVNNLTLGN